MENKINFDNLPDEFFISYYQDLMFNLAKSSRDIQNIFLTAYYNLKDSKQNKLITKVSLFSLLGFSAIKMLVGLDHSNDIFVYMLGLNISLFNFVAEKYNIAKFKMNERFLEKFILNNIADDYLETAAYDPDDSKMERLLNCMAKAFCNIIHSNEHMVRIQNYKYMQKYTQTTNSLYLNQDNINDSLILLSRCLLDIDRKNSEHLLYKKALLGDLSSKIMFYLSAPNCNTQLIDNKINNLPLNDLHLSYEMFMACFVSDRFTLKQIEEIKKEIEFKNKQKIFLDYNSKPCDFSAMCECFYYKLISGVKNLTLEEEWAYKKAERYLKRCKTEVAFFYQSFENTLKSGKSRENGIAALQNFAARGLSYEVIEPEKISVKNIYEKELQKE